jgi:glycosyltransferase involved in cell wall biosynthesis
VIVRNTRDEQTTEKSASQQMKRDDPMNILFVSPIEVVPPNSGGARRILDMGKTLATLGHKVTILDITIASGLQNRKPRVLASENNFEVITTGLFHRIVMKHLIYSDIVQFEFPYFFFMMIFLRMIGKNYVLDEHDVEFYLSRNIQQITGTGRKKKAPHLFLNKLFQQTPLVVLLLEGVTIRLSSMVFTCSQVDATKLSQLYRTPQKRIVVIPNGVRALSYQKVKKHFFDRPTVVFVGTFDNLANVYGAKILVDKIMPIVRKEVPDVLFMIIGPNPPAWLLEHARVASKGSLIVTGEVDDVRPLIAGASVAVAPIYHGSGTRLKLVEYMHLGKPIVSTTKGAEGLDVENGASILLRDDPSDFARAIVTLIKDTEVASTISRKGKELALKKYSWETNAKLVDAIYKNLVQI